MSLFSPTTHDTERTRPTPTGPVLFARYAFGPNRLGLCGPEDWRSLLELGAAAVGSGSDAGDGALEGPNAKLALEIDRGLRELAAGFEGAFPYLELIAAGNGIGDPLDLRVVDAYWIGNSYSDRVDPVLMTRSISERFQAKLPADVWRWLQGKPEAGARPTHAFHVFDVFPMVGTQRRGNVADALGLMDACRIRWGRVVEVAGDSLVVSAVPLELAEGKLALAEAKVQTVRRWLDGTGFVADVAPGDVVSLHWDWACEVLGPSRLEALQRRTVHQLELANQTL
jgi:hypothetical protein